MRNKLFFIMFTLAEVTLYPLIKKNQFFHKAQKDLKNTFHIHYPTVNYPNRTLSAVFFHHIRTFFKMEITNVTKFCNQIWSYLILAYFILNKHVNMLVKVIFKKRERQSITHTAKKNTLAHTHTHTKTTTSNVYALKNEFLTFMFIQVAIKILLLHFPPSNALTLNVKPNNNNKNYE
jgi:hypothetical protein